LCCVVSGLAFSSNSRRCQVMDIVASVAPAAEFRAISDAGWFLAGPGLVETPCVDSNVCNFEHRIRTGADMWGLKPQEACAAAYPDNVCVLPPLTCISPSLDSYPSLEDS
jgi:hypothetical protein